MNRSLVITCCAGLGLCGAFLAGLASADPLKDAQDATKKAKDALKEVKDAVKGQPEMPKEMMEMMQAMEKAGTPGEHHKHLAQFAGEWDGSVKFRWSPESPWEEHATSCKGEMELGGRFLYMHWKSDMGGMPFHGVGVQGYSNVQKKHIGVWFDNMMTGMSLSEGTCDSTGKVFNWTDVADNPMGGTKKSRTVQTVSDNAFSVESYENDPTGKEFKSMEIRMVRKGAAPGK